MLIERHGSLIKPTACFLITSLDDMWRNSGSTTMRIKRWTKLILECM